MKLISFILALTLLALSGCKKDSFCNCLKKTGDEVSEDREVSSFTSIEMNNNVDVIIKPDTTYKITVTCGKNLVDGIKTEVVNNKLIIRNINKCNWMRDFKNTFTVEVAVKDLTQLTNNGSGNLYFSDTLYQPEFQVDNWSGTGTLNLLLHCNETRLKLHTGPADINASGYTAVGYIYTAGNGFCNTRNLVSDYCYVTTKSTGDVNVTAVKELQAEIKYNGDVYYSGSPATIKSVITGNGKLIKNQ